jgi:hypothetical protein
VAGLWFAPGNPTYLPKTENCSNYNPTIVQNLLFVSPLPTLLLPPPPARLPQPAAATLLLPPYASPGHTCNDRRRAFPLPLTSHHRAFPLPLSSAPPPSRRRLPGIPASRAPLGLPGWRVIVDCRGHGRPARRLPRLALRWPTPTPTTADH